DEEPQIYLIDADGGEARRLTQLATGASAIKWFPDGKRIAFISWVWPDLRGETAQARRHKQRKEDKVKAHRVEHATYRFWDHWLSDGRVPHLFVADLRGGCSDLFEATPYELVRADPDQHCYDISPDGRFVAFGFDPAEEKKLDDEFDIVELDLKSRRFRNLTPGAPYRDYRHPPAVYARRGDGAERKAESFNDALLRRFQLGASEELSFRGWGGETVQMWLVFPPRFDPKKKYPLLHSIHGGPHAISADSWHFRWNNHVFAAQGYIVAGVNFQRSSSFGQEFIESIRHEFGKRELADIEAATALLSRRRYVDRKRVFASGGSYGGYLVAWMNGRVPQGRYRAYVCHAGCFDWVSMFADDSYP